MHTVSVGELLLPGQTKLQEGTYLEYTSTGPMLIMAVDKPTEKEIKAAKSGKMEFALYETDVLIWFLYKIHGFGWSDAPFSIRLYDGRGISFDWSEEILDGAGLGLNVVLVDAGTGIVKALRLIGMPTEFSREFRAATLRQLERPFSADTYLRHINHIYKSNTSDDLLLKATVKTRPE